MKLLLTVLTIHLLLRATLAGAGDLDPTFDTDGIVITPMSASTNFANAVAMQSDGKIIVAGFTLTGIATLRYNANGSLDNTFDGDGAAFVLDGWAQAVAIQTDGKIIVAGSDGDFADLDFKVLRYNANGTLDTSFDGDGIVTTAVGTGYDVAYAIGIQTDGKIVVSGRSGASTTAFAIVRYNADGSLDTTFDSDGKVVVPGAGNPISDSLKIQPDGKIVVAHNFFDGSAYVLTVLRYNADGSLDTSFDSDGRVVTTVGTNVEFASLDLQTDGRIVVAASSYTSAAAGYDFYVVRYNTDGSLDTSFGTDGIVVTQIGTGGAFDMPKAIAIQPNGKILVGGRSDDGPDRNFALVRYNANGSLDTFWGNAGIVTTDLGGDSDGIHAIAIQTDSKILAVGESDTTSPGSRDFAVARYNGDILTSASVSVAGRVAASTGLGIGRATVSLTDSTGTTRTAISSAFGYYRFEEVEVGQTYVLAVRHKRFSFSPPSRLLTVNDEMNDVNFLALE